MVLVSAICVILTLTEAFRGSTQDLLASLLISFTTTPPLLWSDAISMANKQDSEVELGVATGKCEELY